MKDYGILLTGTESALWYIKQIQLEYAQLKGKDHFFSYQCIQCDFPPINELLPHQMIAAAEMLYPYLRDTFLAESKGFILANITLDEALSRLKAPLPDSFLSLEKILSRESFVSHAPHYLLGTAYTMESSYFKQLFLKNEVKLSPLTQELKQKVDRLRKTYYKAANPQMATETFSLLNQLEGRFIIACTELAMAYEDSEVKPSVIHLPKLQLKHLILSSSI